MAGLPDLAGGQPPALGTPGDPYFTGSGQYGIDVVALRSNAPHLFQAPPLAPTQAPPVPAPSSSLVDSSGMQTTKSYEPLQGKTIPTPLIVAGVIVVLALVLIAKV